MVNILIDGAGTVTCQSVIKGLKKQNEFDVYIVTIDMAPDSVGAYWADKFYQIPSAKDDNFLSSVMDILVDENIDLFIPIIDYGFETISKNKDIIKHTTGTEVIISSFNTIEICNDKLLFSKTIEELNTKIESIKTCKMVKNYENFPYFVKPRFDGRASIDCYKINNNIDFDYVTYHVDLPLFTEYIEGDEYTVDTLNDFDGNFIGGLTRIREETKSGVSYKAKVVHDNIILTQAKVITESIGIIGPANLQCFKNDNGVFWFEINPRFSGTLSASLGAGFNSPYLLLKLYYEMGVSKEDLDYKDIFMLRYWDELILDEKGNVLCNSQTSNL